MDPYQILLKPALFHLDPEVAHNLTIAGMRLAGAATRLVAGDAPAAPALAQTLWGLRFAAPVGLAAGLDKNGVAIAGLAACGFSHVEIGTVTGQGQAGNPRPRLFRLVEDQAVINRMGFNNRGAAAVRAALAARYDAAGGARRPGCVLGINLGKSKVVDLGDALADYEVSVRALGAFADYVVVNVSSPNTPGLRDLQGEAHLRPLLAGVRAALDGVAPPLAGVRRPLLLKIAPDLSEAGIDAAVDVALETGCDGLIATNTTITRAGLATPARRVEACGAGGLSGAPLRARATAVLARVARRVAGRAPVIGVGGIDSADAAWEKITHGASLVQVYSALVYQGPALVGRINQGLAERVERLGLRTIGEAVGRDL